MAKKVPLNVTEQDRVNLGRLERAVEGVRKSGRLEEFCVEPDLLNCGWSCVFPTQENPHPEKPAIIQVYFSPGTKEPTIKAFYRFLRTYEPGLKLYVNPDFENTSDYPRRDYRLQNFEHQ